jgi:hypothetical protein
VALLLAGWWGSLAIAGDGPWIMWCALGGIVLGVILDATVLRRWTLSLFDLSMPALVGVALFYSVGIYGMFMGMPAVNLLVGVAGGYVVGRRAVLHGESADGASVERRRVSAAASVLMALLCCATAWLALSDPYTAGDVRGMLGLGFTPSRMQLWTLSIVGGLALVAMEYALTTVAATWAARLRKVA